MMVYPQFLFNSDKVQVTAGYPQYPGGGYHRGGDFKIPGVDSEVVYSVFDGIVIRSEYGTGRNAAYGNYLVVYNETDNLTYVMAHFLERLIFVGDVIKAGEPVGIYDSTGNVTGPHVHIEVFKGKGFTQNVVDPFPYVGLPNEIGIYDTLWGLPEKPEIPDIKIPDAPPPGPAIWEKQYRPLPLYYYLRRF